MIVIHGFIGRAAVVRNAADERFEWIRLLVGAMCPVAASQIIRHGLAHE
jgi:hypothetical protein